MKIIVVGSLKGGVGKTTVSTGLACEATAGAKKVAVIDLDPMQSTARWFELRGDVRGPVLVTDVGDLRQAVTALQSSDFDYLIVDTPPGPLSTVMMAVACADLVVMPCRPSPIDAEASELMVELLKRQKTPYVFLLNAVPPKSQLVTGAIEFLRAKGEVLDASIAASEVLPLAMIEGRTAGEKGEDGGDLKSVWRDIKKRLATPAKKTRKG